MLAEQWAEIQFELVQDDLRASLQPRDDARFRPDASAGVRACRVPSSDEEHPAASPARPSVLHRHSMSALTSGAAFSLTASKF